MSDNYEPDLVAFTDENGEESLWEHILTYELDDNCYVAMLPADGDCCDDDCDCDDCDDDCEDEGGVWLLKVVEDEDGGEAFTIIEDEDEYNRAADEYTRLVEDAYNEEVGEEE